MRQLCDKHDDFDVLHDLGRCPVCLLENRLEEVEELKRRIAELEAEIGYLQMQQRNRRI